MSEPEPTHRERAAQDASLRRDGMRAVLEALSELGCPHGCQASPPCEYTKRLDEVGSRLVGWRR